MAGTHRGWDSNPPRVVWWSGMQLYWHRKYPASRRFRQERLSATEYLDRDGVDALEKRRSYRDLERVSYLPGHFAPLRAEVARLLARRDKGGTGAVRLVELGAGTGLVGLRLARALAREGHTIELVATDILSLPELIRRMSTEPAALFRVPGGTLRKGVPADVVIFDPSARWTVDPALFRSRSRNTPFAGRELVGRPERTLVGGRTVFAANGV